MKNRFQIDRISIRNFRSIQYCDVQLSPITFLVGPNASGKTSFVDAVSFVADALSHSLKTAADDKGGIESILHAPITWPACAEFDFRISSQEGLRGAYSLVVKAVAPGSVRVEKEECRLTTADGVEHHYVVQDGAARGSAAVFPAVSRDRVYLVAASGLPEFRPVYDVLSGIRRIEPTLAGLRKLLFLFNANDDLATRFRDLLRDHPHHADVIQQYLRAIAPPFDHIEVVEADNRWRLRFIEKSVTGSQVFNMSQVSAGLLNSFEVLLDLFEPPRDDRPVSAVLIEEPDAFLHPGAIRVMKDSFLEASDIRQVIVTSHSPDLLDDPGIPGEWIRVVYRDESGTHINPLDSATESIIRDRLFTAGELLRQGSLSLPS